jgi:hypothetical protein
MNTLRSMSISRAVADPGGGRGHAAGAGVADAAQIHGDLYQAKAEKTRHVVQTASRRAGYYHGLETAGTLSREAAQQQALQVVRGLRYDQSDYFWINDLQPKMIMHPANPKLDGQDLSAIRDPTALPCSTRWSSWPVPRAPAGRLPLAQARRQRAGGQDLLYSAVRAVGLGHRLGRLHRRRAGRVRPPAA